MAFHNQISHHISLWLLWPLSLRYWPAKLSNSTELSHCQPASNNFIPLLFNERTLVALPNFKHLLVPQRQRKSFQWGIMCMCLGTHSSADILQVDGTARQELPHIPQQAKYDTQGINQIQRSNVLSDPNFSWLCKQHHANGVSYTTPKTAWKTELTSSGCSSSSRVSSSSVFSSASVEDPLLFLDSGSSGSFTCSQIENPEEYLKPLQCSGLYHTSFPWMNKWLVYTATTERPTAHLQAPNTPCPNPVYHPPTSLSSLAISQKVGRSDTLWKSCSGNTRSFTWKLKTQKQQSLSQEQILDPSDRKDTALALFPKTSIGFSMFQSHFSPKTSSWARLWGVTEGISYLLDVRDIPYSQLTVSTPSDQTLLFRYQSHPPNLSRGTMWAIGLWFLL